MKKSNSWSKLPNLKQEKPRVYETDKGFLVFSITDETPNDAVERLDKLIESHSETFDACKSQHEVYTLEGLKKQLLKEAGVIDS